MDVAISASPTPPDTETTNMTAWVLVIFMFSPGGDFLGKAGVPMSDSASCQKAVREIAQIRDPMQVQLKTLCVTKDHWDGKKLMKNVPLD